MLALTFPPLPRPLQPLPQRLQFWASSGPLSSIPALTLHSLSGSGAPPVFQVLQGR